MCLEERVVINICLIDSLNYFIGPFVVLFEFVVVAVVVVSEAFLAEVGILFAVYLRTVVFCLFLMHFALLFYSPIHVFQFVLGRQFLTIHSYSLIVNK